MAPDKGQATNWTIDGVIVRQIQIQIQNSLLLPIYIVLFIYDDMYTMYMYLK